MWAEFAEQLPQLLQLPVVPLHGVHLCNLFAAKDSSALAMRALLHVWGIWHAVPGRITKHKCSRYALSSSRILHAGCVAAVLCRLHLEAR